MRGIRVWARLLGLHRAGDAPVEQDCLLDRRIIEGDESERPRCHECAEAPVRLEFADQLRLAVDLRERTVIGAVGVSDGVLGTVTRSIEPIPAAGVALRPQRARVPVQAEDDEVIDDAESQPRRGNVSGRCGKKIGPSGIDGQDPCAFDAATSSTT